MWLQYSLTSLEFINQLDILFKRSAAMLKRWVKVYCNMVSKKLEFFVGIICFPSAMSNKQVFQILGTLYQ